MIGELFCTWQCKVFFCLLALGTGRADRYYWPHFIVGVPNGRHDARLVGEAWKKASPTNLASCALVMKIHSCNWKLEMSCESSEICHNIYLENKLRILILERGQMTKILWRNFKLTKFLETFILFVNLKWLWFTFNKNYSNVEKEKIARLLHN